MNITPEKLAQMIAVAVNNAMMAQKINAKPAKDKPNTLVDGKTERQLQIEVQTVRAFKKAGFKDVKPKVNVLTYNGWMAKGYKVKTGEKSIKVKQFRLFHETQVEFVGIPTKAEQRAEGEAAMASAQA